MSAGRLIRLVRRERGLTITELAAAVGVHRNTLSKWEREVAAPPLSALGPLCRALRVRPDLFVDLPSRGWRAYLDE